MLAVISQRDRRQADLLEKVFLIINDYTPKHLIPKYLIATKIYVVSNQKKENNFPSLWTLWENEVFMDEELYNDFLTRIEIDQPKFIVTDYEGLSDTFSEALTYETIKTLAEKFKSTIFYIILPKEMGGD